MWLWSRESIQLAISRDHVAVSNRDARSAASTPVKSPISSLIPIESAIASCVAGKRGMNLAVDIVVSDAYARFWIVVPPKNASTRSDLRICTLWRFEELFGESPQGWNVQADWHATRPFVACALPLALTDAIRSAIPSRRVRIQRCVPRFIAEWQTQHRQCRHRDTWFAVSNDSTLTVALIQKQKIVYVRKMVLHACEETQLHTIASALRSIALQQGALPPRNVYLCGDICATSQPAEIEGFKFDWVAGATARTPTTGAPRTMLEAPDR